MQLPILDPSNPNQDFPAIETALKDPDGLLAAGGCLSSQRLINAYQLGIFPWYSPEEPILWWAPNPRLVLFPDKLRTSRSLKKTIRKEQFRITFDQAFPQVMQYCAAPRDKETSTWITEEIYQAYNHLHQQGISHSVEVWFSNELVGGLYGVAIGQVFFGESMFHKKTDASKVAFYYLTIQLSQWGYQLIDCQVQSNHLSSLGAQEIDRKEFSSLLKRHCCLQPHDKAWQTK
ncbi:MAG: leucyl/phenylalanyl-tRNA--protein transferase [Methylococcales symbiont of Hymedesmia sp. n. MRB-2018]|nr:MAG: leucyl/phenylalanyl-tRNA--protein transferase [Methylococcales symbiont of Hymedesmia sp. n. MRB-2018]KAF3983055.1 MAG: leucyl/phenylalanyl-tRNA--protein transferase [Methylococcales symbiont of Hymedesmia sp. n. MRB-2018]